MTNAIWLSPNSFVSDLFRDGYRDETDRQTHVPIFIAAKKPTPKEEKVGREIIIIIRNVGETCGKLTGENHKSVKPKKTSQTDVRRHSWISFQMAAAILRFLLRLGFVVLASQPWRRQAQGTKKQNLSVRRGYLERMKRDTGARIICASLFFPFSWILLKKRRARFFVYFGHGATHPRSNFPLSFLLFFIPNFSLENQPEKSCCCCLLRVVDLAPWLLIAPAWRLKGNFFDPQFRRWNVIQNV